MQALWCHHQIPQPQDDTPVPSVSGQVTEVPLPRPGPEQGPVLGDHTSSSEGHMLSDQTTVPTDLWSEVLPHPADVTGGERASGWTTPLSPERASSSLPSCYLLFLPISPFNFI